MNGLIKTSWLGDFGSIGMFAVAFSSAVAALYVMLSGAGAA